jgi:sphinganine C4-monooxygenase
VLGAIGEGDFTGKEDYDLGVWVSRVHAVFEAMSSVRFLLGIDLKRIAIILHEFGSCLPIIAIPELDMTQIDVLIATSLYWYIIPTLQLIFALIIADIAMYCLHRLGHTNKWIYSQS